MRFFFVPDIRDVVAGPDAFGSLWRTVRYSAVRRSLRWLRVDEALGEAEYDAARFEDRLV